MMNKKIYAIRFNNRINNRKQLTEAKAFFIINTDFARKDPFPISANTFIIYFIQNY